MWHEWQFSAYVPIGFTPRVRTAVGIVSPIVLGANIVDGILLANGHIYAAH